MCSNRLGCAGLHELAAHAGLLDPVAIEHALHRPVIVLRGRPRHDPFPNRSLPSPVVLQPRVTVQLNFLAVAGAYPSEQWEEVHEEVRGNGE
jgi:hypothetical protein